MDDMEHAFAIQDRMFKADGGFFYPGNPGDPEYEGFIDDEGADLTDNISFPFPTGRAAGTNGGVSKVDCEVSYLTIVPLTNIPTYLCWQCIAHGTCRVLR